MRTLIEKELRENLRWLLVGLALIGPLLWYAVPKSLANEIRHTEHGLATMMLFGASVFAIGLGVMQSFADLRTTTRSFLFHRSVSIGTIFHSKLIVGAIVYFAAVGIPLLVVALWFARQGIDYLPVRPIQVLPAAVVALACFGFHPATMFMLARSARWFGTKLFPLFFVTPLILLGLTTLNTLMHGPAINLLLVSLIVSGLLILVAAAQHAWVYSVADDGNPPRLPIGIASIVTLSFAALVPVSYSFSLISILAAESLNTDSSSLEERYAMDDDGNVWRAKSKRGQHGPQTYVTGDRLRKDEVPDTRRRLPENLKLRDLTQVLELRKPVSCFDCDWRFAGDRQVYFDSRGNVLLYDRTQDPPLQSIVSSDGKPFVGNPLSQPVRMSAMILFHLYEDQLGEFWVDLKGIYRFNESTREVRKLVNLTIDALGPFDTSRKEFFILSEGRIHLYRIMDQEGNVWTRPTADSNKDAWNFEIQEIAVTPPLPSTTVGAMKICVIDNVNFTVVLDGPRPSFWTFNSDSDTSWKSTPFRKPSIETPGERVLHVLFSILPCLTSIIVFVVVAVGSLMEVETLPSIDAIRYSIQDEYAYVIFAIVVMLLSMIATSYACRRRMLSRTQTATWCCWAVLLGWATPLAVLAIYTRPTCSQCTRCAKQRRIDLRKCENCGSEWERPAPKGIEIFDESFSRDRMLEGV